MEKEQAYKQLKDICTAACHERQACKEGYKDMLAAENVGQMMAVWRKYLEDVVESKYVKIINRRLPELYPSIKEEMNQAGVYVNECPVNAQEFVVVIVTTQDVEKGTIITIHGHAKAYVLGQALVRAKDHSQVYSKVSHAFIHLHDDAYGYVSKGFTQVYDNARLVTQANACLYDQAICEAHGGQITAFSFKKIEAYGKTVVYADRDRNVTLHGEAQFISPQNI